ADRDRDREVPDVRDAHRERRGEAERAAPLLGAAMQRDDRLAERRAPDLDLAPAHAADAQAEDLRDRFLRRPASREVEDVAPAVRSLPLRVDAPKEPLIVPVEHSFDPHGLDDVDPDLVREAHSTVTAFARLRGWSTSFPRRS